ncbi:Thiamin ABC transporter, ATPase component / Thiamine transport ATP-binding protein thiQ [hydrothermal vent metagenome]|uniref:Thiamin ABC transporter, ATPase component / Thiamine transport ATP-binding protein thiQ n=1 Tax=hydrothermal vent metagenome TaxID=652676 RepID=A0A3B0TQV4_9ZZZZ
MLIIERLNFSYPQLGDQFSYSLRVGPGEIVAITGRSGAGKSTLLDLVAGFIKPLSGTISFNGDDLVLLPVEKRPVSILFQADNLFDHLSVNANLALGLAPGSKKDQALETALKEVGLSGFGGRRVSNLSGGQQQRIALARTLLRNRPILLLDEPFANLDAKTAQDMRDLVSTLGAKHKWCTLIVSHQLEDMSGFAKRSYRLEEGKLISA